MEKGSFFNDRIERLPRADLDALIDERVRYTVKYAFENSPFYKKWFSDHQINPDTIREHEDLIELPLVSGGVIRTHQPPATEHFLFKSADWKIGRAHV